MNLYFLVEGKQTEPKVYRKWLKYLLPDIKEVEGFDEVQQNNYFLRGARHKSPSFTKRLKASILEVNECAYNYLIICIDAEERTVEETRQGIMQIFDELSENGIQLKDSIYFEIIVQNKCIETWFLGNQRIFIPNPHNKELVQYIQHFNVTIDDPELMTKPPKSKFGSDAQFHLDYLRKMFAERNITYSKTSPKDVTEAYYLQQLQNRVQETNHLNSFKYLCNLCKQINQVRDSI